MLSRLEKISKICIVWWIVVEVPHSNGKRGNRVQILWYTDQKEYKNRLHIHTGLETKLTKGPWNYTEEIKSYLSMSKEGTTPNYNYHVTIL